MRDAPDIAAARQEVERSRARVMATAQELQDRLKPKTLARDAWEGAKVKGADLPPAIAKDRQIDPDRIYTLASTDFTAANQSSMGKHGGPAPTW